MENKKAHLTAIARKAPSVPMRHLDRQGLLKGSILDYGCGRGYDAKYYCAIGYDPTYQPIMPTGKFDTVVCNYVLNVVDPSEQNNILQNIMNYMRDESIAYLTVRRDIKQEGITSRGTYQRNVLLPFHAVRHTASFTTYRVTMPELFEYLYEQKYVAPEAILEDCASM